jgi:hypothetical protein
MVAKQTLAGVMKRARVAGALALVATVLATGCYLDEAQKMRDSKPDDRPWICRSSGTGGHHGDSHGVADPAYAGQTKGDLSWDDCLAVAKNFDDVVAWAGQWPTRGAAEADGWFAQTAYSPGMGTHHARAFGGTFDATRPMFLQYGGNGPDAPLVGVSWWVSSGDRPPEGFPGGNDWWHTHRMLCYQGNQVIGGEDMTPEDCRFVGGSPSQFPGYWMVHAWVFAGWENKVDVYAGTHPCLLADGPAPAGHPCWAEAAGDAAEGHDHEHSGH